MMMMMMMMIFGPLNINKPN